MQKRTDADPVARAQRLLQDVSGTTCSDAAIAEHAVTLARLLLEQAELERRPIERKRSDLLAQLMEDPDGQAFTTLLTDRAHRSKDAARTVDAARALLRRLGIPRYLPWWARTQLHALLRLGPFFPELAARGLRRRIREESSHVVLAAEPDRLAPYMAERRARSVRVNLNELGEAVLGEAEARRRVERYTALLARPEVESISVKLSSIFSQVDLLSFEDTRAELSERLQVIYRAARDHLFERPDGTRVPKLVNLDMEAYRDLELTLAVFRDALSAPDLASLTAGAVLQAYLPEAPALQRELTAFAQERVDRGGAPLRLRVVKGANLLTERAESALRGFAVPTFDSKAEVDASYKLMLEHGCAPAHARVLRLGVASHNVFDLALGLVLRALHGTEGNVELELLEGMADPLCRTITAVAGSALVYAPICKEDAMQTAIAYLMRRLDENTAEENFLRKSFGMRAGDAAFDAEAQRFEQAWQRRGELDHTPRRQPSRSLPPPATTATAASAGDFENEPDTDFSVARNRNWITTALARWQTQPIADLALGIGGESLLRAPFAEGFDPSRPGIVPYRFALATESEVTRAVETATDATRGWARQPFAGRARILRLIAGKIAAERAELIAAMVLDAGKRVTEADTEVSEAIDFARYYARSYEELQESLPDLALAPRGVVLVTPPWNFPLAIPAGGVFAALVAGNAVILKPALETVLVAERLAQLCWAAGVPKAVLQLVFCEDELGSRLIADERVAQVVLTGATSTARLFRELRPGLELAAETGGKNAIVVSALADRDEAIKDTVASAFGHAGQKCSACSLLVCEAEVYDDPTFLETLRDAAASLPVGSAWQRTSVVTPLIRPAQGALLRGLTELEAGESWLLEPARDPGNPRLWSPGIKLGVREGSFMHVTELFGPVLSVMRAEDLEHAIRIANGTPYGLTAGLHSLDEGEQQRWAAQMQAGNLYINRPITGAIVRRQPFGGHKASSFGKGAKAGGPSYVLQMIRPAETVMPKVVCPPEPRGAELCVAVRRRLSEDERERLGVAVCSYAHALRTWFRVDHDPSQVLGERNVLRYVPCHGMRFRASADADPMHVLLAVLAASSAGVRFGLSLDEPVTHRAPYLLTLPGVDAKVEDAETFAEHLEPAIARIRALGSVEHAVLEAADALQLHVAAEPPLLSGRVELLHYYREQTLSHRYHRYGNLAPGLLLRGGTPALRPRPV